MCSSHVPGVDKMRVAGWQPDHWSWVQVRQRFSEMRQYSTILYQKNDSKASRVLQADFVRVLQTWGTKWCCVDSIFSKTGQAAEFPDGNQDPCQDSS